VTTYRSRADAGLRARRGCTSFPTGRPLGVACHWPGSDAKLVGLSDAQVASQLRGWQAYHMDSKGWSDIAYGVGIDWHGCVWELRGLDCRTAANGGTQSNADYTACLWILGTGDKPTDAMVQAFRDWRTTRLLRRYPGATAVKTHNDVRAAPTECPGAAVTALVRGGTLTKQPEVSVSTTGPEKWDAADWAAFDAHFWGRPVRFWSPSAGEIWGERPPPAIKHLLDMTFANSVVAVKAIAEDDANDLTQDQVRQLLADAAIDVTVTVKNETPAAESAAEPQP
jgi:hypothetical protein